MQNNEQTQQSSAVTTEIMGGLGNQLFQIFATIAYSLKHKVAFYFPNQPIKHGDRKKTYWDTPLLNSLSQFVKQNVQGFIYHEPHFHYKAIPAPPEPPHHLKLFGYFQSYKYFKDQQNVIFKLIKLRELQFTTKNNTNQYENTIALHFRVGDYKNLTNYHPLMTLEYYTAALTQLLHHESEPQSPTHKKKNSFRILYFCEEADQDYVQTKMITPLQQNPLFKDKFTFECIDHKLSDWQQLIVMSLCSKHVIANSTFSWWGAYLSGNASSRSVYYPTTWFGAAMGDKNMSDMFPPHWNRINV
jgi:hypothetical protein